MLSLQMWELIPPGIKTTQQAGAQTVAIQGVYIHSTDAQSNKTRFDARSTTV